MKSKKCYEASPLVMVLEQYSRSRVARRRENEAPQKRSPKKDQEVLQAVHKNRQDNNFKDGDKKYDETTTKMRSAKAVISAVVGGAMAGSQRNESITRCINAVVKRINDSALIRRPLRRYGREKRATLSSEMQEDDELYEDDSPDYVPPESTAIGQKRKRKRTPLAVCNRDSSPTTRSSKSAKLEASKLSSPLAPDTQGSLLQSSCLAGEDIWGERVPSDVLHHIFQCAMLTEPTIPFLARMQKVCRHWRQTAQSTHLWAVIDLEYLKNRKPQIVFGGLQNHATGIRDLSVARWVKLTMRQLEEFLRSTKEIRALNVSFCHALDLRRLLCNVIPENCPKLNSLDLSYIDPTGHKKITSLLREFLSLENGRQLESLFLNGNALANLRHLCAESARSKATETVRILHLSRVCMSSNVSHKIRLVDFVNAFPNLHVLHMADAMLDFVCSAEEENDLHNSWPHLYDCNIATSSNWHRYTDVYDVIVRLLGRCRSLRRLDLSGFCVQDKLVWLRETPLAHLNLSRVRNMAKNAVTIDFFPTWGRSLETLSIAWVVGCVGSLCALFAEAKKRGLTPRLKRLDLTGTCVTATQLSVLLDVCQSLEFVDVQSCRGMPLGMKQAYHGMEALTNLRKKLEIAKRELNRAR